MLPLELSGDDQNVKAPGDPWSQVGFLLLAIIWSLVAWNILVGFPEGIYWHFLDPYNLGIDLPPIIVLVLAILSFLALDIGPVQSLVSSHPGLVTALPPLLFALSAIRSVYARSTFLTLAAASLGWSVGATLGAAPPTMLRHFGASACLATGCVMPMVRWCFDSMDPFLQSPVMKVVLGGAGLAAVAVLSARDGRRSSPKVDAWGKCDCGSWLAALSAGLMGGSALALYQTYLSTATQPAASTFLMPSYFLGLVTVALLGLSTLAVSVAYQRAPDWTDSLAARLIGGLVPAVACVLQLCAGVAIEYFGPIQGTGGVAYAGLLALAAAFPLMLALIAKSLAGATKAGRLGTALLVAGLTWAVFFLIYFAVLTGGTAPVGGALFKGRSWLLALILGILWSTGVAFMQESSPASSEYLSFPQQNQPSQGAPNVSLPLLAVVFVVFSAVAVPIKIASMRNVPPFEGESLVVVGYNVQQGFTLEGWPNVDCVTEVLRDVGADWVGLSESNAAHSITANNDVSLAYAARLGMSYFQGAPGATPSVDEAIISRLPLQQVSTSSLEILMGCSHCPTQTHLWVRSVVLWGGVEVQLHSLHTEWFSDPSTQIKYVAEQIREHFSQGPLVLVGDFNMPQNSTVRPYDTALRSLVEGTGLTAAGGVLDPDVQMPLPRTEFISDLHLDYVFYRGLDLESVAILDNVACSDHMPIVARFHRPKSAVVRL